METSRLRRPTAVFNDIENSRNLSNTGRNLDQKVKVFAKDKIASKHFLGKVIEKFQNSEAQAIIRLFGNLFKHKNPIFYERKVFNLPKKLDDNLGDKTVPIGIFGYNWINALMQFIMHVPSLKNMFNYTPKSFSSFNIFIDSYEEDKALGRLVATMNSDILINCLFKKFAEKFFIVNKGKIDVYKILSLIMDSFFEEKISLDFLESQNSDLLAFQPKWQIVYDVNKKVSIEQYILDILNKKNKVPKELLVALKWFSNGRRFVMNKKNCPRKKILFWVDNSYSRHLDLDAFIEYRQDGKDSGDYITYLKIDETWYQCNDARICTVPSNNLQIALSRSIMLHYNCKYSNKRL